MVVKFRIYLYDSLYDKEMNQYNSQKDISWKITSMVTEYYHTARMHPKPMGTIKPEKASWLQQFTCFQCKYGFKL